MKRLMWGAFLFLIAASGSSKVEACNWKSLVFAPESATALISPGGNTVVISSDDDFVTIVIYSPTDPHSEWM